MEAGADPNAELLGNSALMYSCFYGQLEAVRFLLQHGAKPFHVNSSGVTPLMWAVEKQKEDVVRELLQHKVNVNQIDNQGLSGKNNKEGRICA